MHLDELSTPIRAYCARTAASSGAVTANGISADVDSLFRTVRSVGAECQTEGELRKVLQKARFNLYDGFEPSGRMHIAQGIFKAVNVNKCTSGGNGNFIFWVADWFGLMNDKMGGDLEKIKVVGKYFIEVWKAAGMDMTKCEFRWTSDEITKNAAEYWPQALDIVRVFSLARIKKCGQIMGRSENKLTCAQILYPTMQCTDIFFLHADVCQLGVDQRKVNMLARDYCDVVGRKVKPVILSHHMLLGLKQGQAKMSKSDPDSAVFMEDTAEDVRRKISNAYCPKVAEAQEAKEEDDMNMDKDPLKNPCLDYVQHILLSRPGATFKAGGKTFGAIQDVKAAFLNDELSEGALKEALIAEINHLLEPVRRHFIQNKEAAGMLAQIEQWKKEAAAPAQGALKRARALTQKEKVTVVFAPRPSTRVTVDEVLKLLNALEPGNVLWIADWLGFTANCLNGNRNGIAAYYQVLLDALRALAPQLMEKVKVMRESELILSQPSDYWVSVINAGRKLNLENVCQAVQTELDSCSQVVTFLMHVGDVLALATEGGVEVVCCESTEPWHLECFKYLDSVGVRSSVTVKPWRPLVLQKDDAENQLFVHDAETIMNSKVKKSFMEPKNVDFCPVLNMMRALQGTTPQETFSFVVTRKEENGGDIAFASVEKLTQLFAQGDLHPGDLKPSAQKYLNAALGCAREALDQKALKVLEQCGKKKK